AVYLQPPKLTPLPLSSAAGPSLPPASTYSNVQVPWNFLSSFSTSALSSARAPVPPDAVSTRAQSSVTSAIRMRVLLHLHLTTMVSPNDPAHLPGPLQNACVARNPVRRPRSGAAPGSAGL